MQAGDSKKINLPPAEAYGEYNDNLLYSVPKDQVPTDLNAEVGLPDYYSGRRMPGSCSCCGSK